MFQVDGLGGEDDLLRDVGRVVGDALETLGDEDQVDLLLRDIGRALDAGDRGPDHVALELVDLLVLRHDGPCQHDVEIRVGLQGAGEGTLAAFGQALEAGRGRDGFPLREPTCAAGDVPGEVADPLEIGRDLLDREHLAEIPCDRGPEGQYGEHRGVDLDVEPIDLEIGYLSELNEPRRAAIAVFSLLSLVAGIRLRRGGRALWLGALAIIAGLLALFLGAVSWGEAEPISVSIFVQLVALSAVTGGSLAAVVLAHWYLVTPKISERPLIVTTQLLMLALVIQLLLFGVWTAAGIPDFEPFEILTGDNLVFVWLRLIVGLVVPLVLTWMAWRTAITRSMESATGLLYIEFALVMASTIVAAGLLFGEGMLV